MSRPIRELITRWPTRSRSSSSAAHSRLQRSPREAYDEYDAFADDEGVDDRLRADVADALGEKYVEELDI
jgi:hypothetical protein